jgi:hypothetical protein
MYGNQFASSSYSTFSQHLQQQLLPLAQIFSSSKYLLGKGAAFFFPFKIIVVDQ